VTFFVVLRRTGPKWVPGRPLEVAGVDAWTIRLDGRRS
jgi:hypothetical protein